MQSARDAAKWTVVETEEAPRPVWLSCLPVPATSSVEIEAQSTTGGGSMWTTTKQRLVLRVDPSLARPITRVEMHPPR